MEVLQVSWRGELTDVEVCLRAEDAAAVRNRWPDGVVVIEQMFARDDGRSLRAKCALGNMVARARGLSARFTVETPVSELHARANGAP